MKKSELRRFLARAERDVATKARILATYADVLADKLAEIKRLRADVLWQADARQTVEANLETVTAARDRLTAERDDAVTQLGQIGIALAVCPDESILEHISYGRRLAQEQIARLTAENARLEDVITGYSVDPRPEGGGGDVAGLRAEEQPATTRILPTSGVTVKERPPAYFVDDSEEGEET